MIIYISVRCCFVTELSRAKQIHAARLQEAGLPATEPVTVRAIDSETNFEHVQNFTHIFVLFAKVSTNLHRFVY